LEKTKGYKKKYHLKKMSEEKSTADSPSSTKEN